MATHQQRLRTPEFDGCGIGFVADTAGGSSRQVVDLALRGLSCVRHRAAVAADGLSGDGAGILAPLPRSFFARVGAAAVGRPLDEARVGVLFAFLDLDDDVARKTAQHAVADACAAEDLELVGWRPVPIDAAHLGAHALADRRRGDGAARVPRPSTRRGPVPRGWGSPLLRELVLRDGHLQGVGHQ